MTDFAAIDFETANEQPCSVCSVGIVIVRGRASFEKGYLAGFPEGTSPAQAESATMVYALAEELRTYM